MPHQIYCDYLEDKGMDCRLFRTQEVEGITVTNPSSRRDGCGSGNGSDENGDGYGDSGGTTRGCGRGGQLRGDGGGCGYINFPLTGNGTGGSNGLVEMQ